MDTKMEFYITFFFKHQIIIKMFHFQTSTYGAHKASDSYLEKFLDNYDKFMEVAQGIYGKLSINNININVNVNNDQLKCHIKKFIDFLLAIDKIEKDPGLLAIRDDMVNDANQFLYLLTFK